MGIFSKNKKEEKASESTLTKQLVKIDKEVVNFSSNVAVSKENTVQMIHLTSIIEDDKEKGRGQCCTVIGSTEGLVEMLEAAGSREPNFGRILIAVGERLASKNPEMRSFQEQIKKSECQCNDCKAERLGNSGTLESISELSIDNIMNMTPESMDELVKKIVKSAKQG